MRKIYPKSAFTLLELIVAISLVAVVMLGIFSINMVLSNNNQDYSQRYLVKSETQASLNHILNNVSLAVGSSAVANSEGILIGTSGVSDANSFCVHQGANNNIIQSPNTGYNTDIWLCYSWSSNQINWCAETYSGTVDPRGAASCSTANTAGHLISGTSITFLGTAYSMTNPAPAFSTTAGFTITIQNCLNDSAGTCSSTGTSTDPANNPEFQVSGSVFPPGVGTG